MSCYYRIHQIDLPKSMNRQAPHKWVRCQNCDSVIAEYGGPDSHALCPNCVDGILINYFERLRKERDVLSDPRRGG